MIFLRLKSKTLYSVFDTSLGARAFFVEIARLSGKNHRGWRGQMAMKRLKMCDVGKWPHG